MKTAQKVSEEHYRRMFAPDDEDSHHPGTAHLVFHLNRYAHTEGTKSHPPTITEPVGGSSSEQIDWLGESAEQYIQVWKERLQKATTDLFGSVLASTSGRPVGAVIDGRTMSFRTAEEKFDALVGEWRRLRETGCSTAPLINDAYGQIVAMGWDAVPFLLREVSHKSGHWFTALKWITGEDLVTPDMRGNIRAIREAWLRWGNEHGGISRHSPRQLDEEKPSATAGRIM